MNRSAATALAEAKHPEISPEEFVRAVFDRLRADEGRGIPVRRPAELSVPPTS